MYENDVKIDRKMRTKITNDWLMEFPSYKKFKPCAWKKRVGPLEFHAGYSVDYGTNIKPGISYFNLSNPLEFMCANLSIEPKSRRYSLTWLQHEKGLYKEAAAELRQLAPIPIEGSVTLSQIINAYKNYAGHITDERHFEDPALIAAWAGKKDLAEQCLEWGLEAYQQNRKVPYQGTSFGDWYQSMSKKIANPEALQKTVEEQVIYHKLTKIPYEELVIDYA
jgi:hypothetical protein